MAAWSVTPKPQPGRQGKPVHAAQLQPPASKYCSEAMHTWSQEYLLREYQEDQGLPSHVGSLGRARDGKQGESDAAHRRVVDAAEDGRREEQQEHGAHRGRDWGADDFCEPGNVNAPDPPDQPIASGGTDSYR